MSVLDAPRQLQIASRPPQISSSVVVAEMGGALEGWPSLPVRWDQPYGMLCDAMLCCDVMCCAMVRRLKRWARMRSTR